jgi:hypothetical protein
MSSCPVLAFDALRNVAMLGLVAVALPRAALVFSARAPER